MIIINIPDKYKKRERELLIRIACILVGNQDYTQVPYQDGYNWVLDQNNNWWATIKNNQIKINCRYMIVDKELIEKAIEILL